MTRLEVLSRLPREVRVLIRDFEGNLEDNRITRLERGETFPYMDELAKLDALSESCIKGLLSLPFASDEINDAFLGLMKN